MTAQSERYEYLLSEFYGNTLKTTASGEPREITLDCLVGKNEGRYLYETIRATGSKNILEIGMAWGGSSLHMAAALEANTGGHLTVIDPFQMTVYSGIAIKELERLEVGTTVDLIEAKSDVALPSLVKSDQSFEFVFIDGDHRFDGAFVDFHYCQQLTKVGGHMIFDDAQSEPLRKVISFINNNFPNLRFEGIKERRFAHFVKLKDDERADGDSFDF